MKKVFRGQQHIMGIIRRILIGQVDILAQKIRKKVKEY